MRGTFSLHSKEAVYRYSETYLIYEGEALYQCSWCSNLGEDWIKHRESSYLASGFVGVLNTMIEHEMSHMSCTRISNLKLS